MVARPGVRVSAGCMELKLKAGLSGCGGARPAAGLSSESVRVAVGALATLLNWNGVDHYLHTGARIFFEILVPCQCMIKTAHFFFKFLSNNLIQAVRTS